MDEHANRKESANIEGYLNMKGYANLGAREHNARDLSETYERTFHNDDGVISKPIPYFRGSAPNIMEELSLQQEFLAEKKSIATVWRCTARGEYYPLDIED
ncbi:hypothetical protein KCU61_g7765, partial [Aureobasidium melanogenum]